MINKLFKRELAGSPLRGMSLARLAYLLEEGERGAYADLQWLYRTIEKRDAVLRAGKQRRLSALGKLNWSVQTISEEALPAGSSPRMAQAHQSALQKAYQQIANLQQAILWLGSAEFRGFAHLEIWRDERNQCTHLEPVPQWHWVRQGLNGAWQYSPQSLSGSTQGQAINTEDFIIREVEDPIDEVAAISFLRRNLAQKDWDGFVETYGIPSLFVQMPASVPPEQRADYQATAEAVINNSRGVLPAGATLQTLNLAQSGGSPFREHIEYQDQLVVLAITGGKLTMLNEATGIGGSQARVHQDAFDQLAQAEAVQISEVFQRQLDRQILAQAFPEWHGTPLAYFELTAEDDHATEQVIHNAETLNRMGLNIAPSELSQRTGYQLEPQTENSHE